MTSEIKNENSVSKRFKPMSENTEDPIDTESTRNETNSIVDESNESSQDLNFNNSTSVHSLESSKKMLANNPLVNQPNLMNNLNGMLSFLNTYFNKNMSHPAVDAPKSSNNDDEQLIEDEEGDDVTDNESETAALTGGFNIDKPKSNNQLLYEMNNEKKSPIRGKSKFKRAECWNYFETRFCKKTNLYFDHCTVEKNGRVCSAKFVHHGATTRLNKHLMQKHKIPLTIVNKSPSSLGTSSMNPVSTSMTPSSSSLLNHSEYWPAAGVAMTKTNEIECHSKCQAAAGGCGESGGCLSTSSASSTSSSSHSSLVLFNEDLEHQAVKSCKQPTSDSSDLNMLLISFLLSSSNSFDLVENKWFRMFAQVLNSSYKMPTKEELVGLLSTKFVK